MTKYESMRFAKKKNMKSRRQLRADSWRLPGLKRREDFPAKKLEKEQQVAEQLCQFCRGATREARFQKRGRDLEVQDLRVDKEALVLQGWV